MNSKYSFGKLYDIAIAAGLGIASLVTYLATKASYAFPSVDGNGGAHLEVIWRGLDTSSQKAYPLMESLAGLFGAGNASACVFGALSVVLAYVLTAMFIRSALAKVEKAYGMGPMISRIGGAVAAVVLMFTPAMHEASTHLEPRLFATFWAMLALLVLCAYYAVPKKISLLVPAFVGWMCAAGLCDSPLFLALLPLYIAAIWMFALRAGRRPWYGVVTFIMVFIVAFVIRAVRVSDEFVPFLRGIKKSFMFYMEPEGWLFVLLFATIPFLVAVAAGRRSLREDGDIAQALSHAALTFATIIAVATPLSPSSQMAAYGILPVAASVFAAFVAGYLAAYWLLKTKIIITLPESRSARIFPAISRHIALTMLCVLALVLAIGSTINMCSFDSSRGEFADRLAEMALDDLGGRSWLISDGSLDDHLLLAAQKRGTPLHIVSLVRDKDDAYLKRLSAEVREANLGGTNNEDLCIWLDTLGVLTFVQHWFEAAPAEVSEKAAIWGYQDIAPAVECQPEYLFFGADPNRTVDWKTRWPELDKILYAPEGWGSYKLWEEKNPLERMRLNLRRHVGLIANNYGVMLGDRGKPSDAFAMYELVLNSIDTDNICSLINELDMAGAGIREAVAKQRALQGRIQSIIADPQRRYDPRYLNVLYGYIRNPQMFSTIGLALARSGNTGEALKNLSRAMDLLSPDNRTAMQNTIASLYAGANDVAKSREIYEGVLAKDPENRDALVGLMRLALDGGDVAGAVKLLEKACAAAGDDPRANSDRAMLAMLKGDLEGAKNIIGKVTDAEPANVRAWSMLASITLQQYDAAKDAKVRENLMRELEDVILPAMNHATTNPADYFVQTVRAQVLLRKGGEDSRKNARDALVAAASSNPAIADSAKTTDMILSLDISLNDTQDAERQAIKALRRNSNAPLANYVMGSLALQRGDYVQAEAFLRRSADATRPVALAMNDLAEVLRRSNRMDEAEKYARRAVDAAPGLYVAWDTLGTIILARNGDLAEAEKCANKACELSKTEDGREADVRMLITLARVQLAKGDKLRAGGTIRKVASRINELSDFEREEFEELRKSSGK